MKIQKRDLLFLMLPLFLVAFCLMNAGCSNLLESSLQNIGTWDVSACVSGFSTCWELFSDNSEKFEDGFISVIDGLGPQS